MSKNNKKAPNLANLIPLGQKNKVRNVLPPQNIAKRVKVEDLNPSTLITTIEQNMKQDNGSSEGLIINFLNSVKSTLIVSSKNGKILPSQCLALFSICKKFPTLFSRPAVIDCMSAILSYNGKESSTINSGNIPFKQQSVQTHSVTASKLKQLHIAICSMLLTCFKDVQKWPVQLVKSYLDDSFSDRAWVDLPECNLLVRNIETAFPNPGMDPRTFFPLSPISEQLSDINDLTESNMTVSDAADCSEVNVVDSISKILLALTSDEAVKPRYEHCRLSIEAMVAGYIKDVVEKKYIPESQVKNILRTFCSLAGLAEMRGAVVAKLDNWLLSKLQTVTLNMLTIMASSCNQNIAQSPNDITFCVYLMLRFKYKTSKPPVQVALLDCIKRISEMHPNNLRNMLLIYVNNELYGTPTVTSGTVINSTNAPTANSSTHTMVHKAISVTLPAIYFRFPVESIKILGDVLHEQMCMHFSDIKMIKLLIRDLCRWIKLAHTNPSGIYSSFNSTGSLPDSLELLDLAQSLLVDRNATESLTSRMNNPLFKLAYVDNMISVLCELQMLSIIRPSVKESFKEKSDHEKKDLESIRHHYTTLRQIRYLTCKWLKIIFRLVEAQVSADRMTYYIKQVMFLNVSRGADQNYVIEDSYAFNEVWLNEADKVTLLRGLTEIPLSEKLIQTMISLGFEKHLCYRPSEIVEMLSELIIRASACASTDIVPMNVTKGETVINNMFACCSYDVDIDESDPKSQLARTLAFKSSFWKVCQALVIMACHCTDSCGAFLWANYPTIKNLMKIVITNNFENANIDEEAIETERLHCETDAIKIIELESSLIANTGDETICIDASNSKLMNMLMLNLPQGATRQPPPDVLRSLQSINSIMKIGDRLSQCRNPDFLLEIVKGQDQSKVANRKWIIDLVKKTSEHNLECLPLLCLTEFIYHDLYDKISSKMPISSLNDTFKRLVNQIRQSLFSSKTDSTDTLSRTVGAFTNSFFNRLSDASSCTRNVARECLYILLQPAGSTISNIANNSQFMDTLKSLVHLKPLQDNVVMCSVVESLKETLKFETDIEVLCCYIELFATMSSTSNPDWLECVVDTVATLILNRPLITEKLAFRDHSYTKQKKTTGLVTDFLAQIFLAYMSQVQQAQAIAIDHREDVIMVTWKEKKVPMSIKVIQCQLAFLSWGIVKSAPSKQLSDMWFIKSSKTYELPLFGSLTPESPSPTVVPQWLINAALNSGLVPVLQAVLNHHIKYNRDISHSISPALLFMPADFVFSYLKLMNCAVKEEKCLLEAWIGTIKNQSSVLSTVEKLFSKSKKIVPTFIDFLRSHFEVSQSPAIVRPNIEPSIIVKPIKKETETKEDNAMEVDGDAFNVWSALIQSYGAEQSKTLSINHITDATNRLLAARDNDIQSIIKDLIKLLKDPKTHSETLRVLNKSDFKLLPLLKLTFRSVDQASFDFCIESFNYLFNSYPHIEKLSVWKVAYNLCLLQGSMFVDLVDAKSEPEEPHSATGPQTYAAMVKSLVSDLMTGSNNDCQSVKDPKKILRKGPKIDQLTVLGLGNCNAGDDSHEVIQRLLFSSHSLYQYSAYFMSDLLHQSDIASLRGILHSLLNKKALSSLNASRALDFIDACIKHPKVQFPVVLIASKKHLWPQQNVRFEITEQELVNLLALIVSEADHLVQHNGLQSHHVNKLLARRCQLVDISSSHSSMLERRCAVINDYVASRLHNPMMEKFTFALYSRMPSLIVKEDKDAVILDNDVFFSNVGCFSTAVLHRVGKRLLSGLVNPRHEVQDLATQACKAMVHRHPRLCVQLLPYISALSDGALDSMECWATFKMKRGNLLYSSLLHLLEIMVPYSLTRDPLVRSSVTSTLHNFLRLLIRYRDQPALFAHFVTKMVSFVGKWVPFGQSDTTAEPDNFVAEHFTEITALSRIYPQFKNLLGYGHKQASSSGPPAPQPSAAELEAALSSRSLGAQLDCLDSLRCELKKVQHSSGLVQGLKQLVTYDMSLAGLCLDDLRSCLCSPMDEVRKTGKVLLARYLNSFPDQANRFVLNCLVPNVMTASYYWSRPFANLALTTLLQTGMLTPDVVPACLSRCGRLFVAGNNGRGNYKESVALLEEVLDNISLESFMDVSVPEAGLVAVKKEAPIVTQKRQFSASDHETHKAKRSRFK